MQTNLDWLAEGKPYPPVSELPRFKAYRENEALFLTKQSEVWQSAYEAMARRLKKAPRSVDTIVNYQQLLSKKTADFVCGEPPTLEYEGDTDALSALLRGQDFYSKLYEQMIDVSRYGNAVAKIVDNRLTVVSPLSWIPIVDPADLKRVTEHVIAYPTALNDRGDPTQLYVEIHRIGSVEIRQYAFEPVTVFSDNAAPRGKIGALLTDAAKQATGLDDFAVQVLTNVTHSGSLFGLDDYTIINSLVSKLMWRLHCADTIMDKHSEPSVSGPSSALERDPNTGMYFLNLGNYFKRDSPNDPDLSYITWDGNLDANFKEIDMLLNQLYILSEMGAAFLEGSSAGAASSGTALKLKMVSPRIKAQRLVGLNDAVVRNIIRLLASVNGITVNADDLQLKWNDGLPEDPVEDAGRRNVETGGKATKSQWSAIKERGLSDVEVEAELEQIRLEAAASMPQVLSGGSVFDGENEDEGSDTDAEVAREGA